MQDMTKLYTHTHTTHTHTKLRNCMINLMNVLSSNDSISYLKGMD